MQRVTRAFICTLSRASLGAGNGVGRSLYRQDRPRHLQRRLQLRLNFAATTPQLCPKPGPLRWWWLHNKSVSSMRSAAPLPHPPTRRELHGWR
jgi:hypothetical protein